MEVHTSATKATALPFTISCVFFEIIWVFGFACALPILYVLGNSPLYVARALTWVARGNHERRIGFIGLGILCIGFLLQAAVNLM